MGSSPPTHAGPARLGSQSGRSRTIEPWSLEQVEAVIDALPTRYRALGVVAAGCGLRQGEVFGLRVCDIDFLRRRIHVEQQVKIVRSRLVIDRPKGGKTRTVPLPDTVAVALAEHLRRYPADADELVFTSRELKPINRTHFNGYVWKPAVRAAGVDPTRANGMHALRHFYASVLIDAGESVRAVADYLGHCRPRLHASRLRPPASFIRRPRSSGS